MNLRSLASQSSLVEYQPVRAGFRQSLAGIVVVLVTIAFPIASAASLWLEFVPASGPPGTEVQGHTVGEGAVPNAAGSSLLTYLSPLNEVPHDVDRIEIGVVRVDAAGNGSIDFVVPDVPPGNYGVQIRCRQCASSSGGRNLHPAGTFEVIASTSITIGWVVAVLVLAGLALATTRWVLSRSA